MIERHEVAPRTSAWHALRARDLTASDLGAVAGVDEYKTAYDIWAWKTGLAEPPAENAAMKLGRWAEPAAIAALTEERPELRILYPLDLYLRDPDIRLGGTPDAFASPKRSGGGFANRDSLVVETKVISWQSFEHRFASGSPPLSWQLQTLTNAMLADASGGILAVLVLGFADAELVVREIPRHAAAEAKIRRLAQNFWTAFDAGHAPQPDYYRDAASVRAMFPPDPAKPVPLQIDDDQLAARLQERLELKAAIAGAERECAAIEAELVHKLAGATQAILPGWRISHKITHRDTYEVAAKDYPVLRIIRDRKAAP
jgi:predicted phage-related endonuclease